MEYISTTNFKTENGVKNENHILKNATKAKDSPFYLHDGNAYIKTEYGLDPIASFNPRYLGINDHTDISHCGYNKFFGLPQETIVNDIMGFKDRSGISVDIRPELANYVANLKSQKIEQLKAVGIAQGGAGTAPTGIFAQYAVDKLVVDTSRKQTPLIEMWPKTVNIGRQANFNSVTAKGAAVWLGEDAALTEQDDTTSQSSVDIKYAYAVGRVTGQAIKMQDNFFMGGFTPSGAGFGRGAGFQDTGILSPLQRTIVLRTRALNELRENTLINGDSTSNDYSGIVTTQSTTNKLDLNGRALQLGDIDDALESAYVDGGLPSLAVCSPGAYTQMQKLLNDKRRGPFASKTIFGTDFITYVGTTGEVTFIPSRYLSNTAGARSIYFMDMSTTEVRSSQDIMFEELSKTNDSQKFMLKVYEAAIFRATGFNSWIGEIE